METFPLCLLLLAGLPGSFPSESMDGKVFVFPGPSNNAYVRLKRPQGQELRSFTLCLSFFTDLTRSFSLFSAASRQHDNELLLFKSPGVYEVCVGGLCTNFREPTNTCRGSGHWEMVCTAWDSTTGIVQLWIEGHALPRKGIAKGYRIPTDLVIMLGQEQDSFGGSLETQQSFVGEMADVYLWDVVLTPEQLRRIKWERTQEPLVDWMALTFEIEGYVVVENSLEWTQPNPTQPNSTQPGR